MKPLLAVVLCLCAIALLPSRARAQQAVAGVTADAAGGPSADGRAAINPGPADDAASLRERRAALSRQLETTDPSSPEYEATVKAIRELDVRLHARVAASIRPAAPQTQAPPSFELGVPGDGLTNQSVQPTLAWGNPLPHRAIEKYVVEISDEKDFSTLVYKNDDVKPQPNTSTSLTVPDGVLEPGVKYFWRVSAVYIPAPGSQPASQLASNAPFSFTTSSSPFSRLSDRGFSLQKTVDGPDASKGAEFSFLRNLRKDSIYTADFAFIYDRRFHQTTRTSVGFQASVEGNLTSDTSASEDAWRFRAGAVIDRNLKPGSLNLLYLSLGGKFEGDQKFDVKKMSFEALLTPTFPRLAIGVSKPLDSARPFQFRWRPFIGLDLGRTIRKGSSGETKDSVLRLTPRVTTKLKLNFLNRALKLSDVYLWTDETFYYLPLEAKKRRNFFTSGLEFDVTDNLGLGVTYKNGESAPKFNRVNTLGATISIRFGKEGQ
jgi:hypothetical protein